MFVIQSLRLPKNLLYLAETTVLQKKMTILYIGLILVGVYFAVLILLYFIQERFLFHPEVLPLEFKFDYSLPFEELFFDTEEGARINGLWFKVPHAKGVVLYFKGNSRSIKGWAKFARDFTGKGYDLLMFDYRGFGKSRGRRTEESMYHDSLYVYHWVKSHYPEDNIIVYGRSMGSGFAAHVASVHNPQMLILDAPYYSFLQLARRYMPILPVQAILKYQIRTDIFLENVRCPIYVFHGTKDRTVPFLSGVRLVRLAGKRGTLITIRGGGHNNLRDFPRYHEYLYYILGALPQYVRR